MERELEEDAHSNGLCVKYHGYRAGAAFVADFIDVLSKSGQVQVCSDDDVLAFLKDGVDQLPGCGNAHGLDRGHLAHAVPKPSCARSPSKRAFLHLGRGARYQHAVVMLQPSARATIACYLFTLRVAQVPAAGER